MAVDYLRDYLGIDPADYSAMERTIAGVSPVGQSIIPTMGATPTVQPRMIDDTPIAFTPRPMQDFGAQISGLEEQINNLMEQMGVLEAEKNDALQQQDVMRAELAQAQQDALTEQASEFEGVKSSLEQQIADLTAQIGSMQEPTIMKDAPVPPRDEQIFVPPKDFVDPRASRPRGEPIGGMVPGGGGIDYGPRMGGGLLEFTDKNRTGTGPPERRDVAGGDRLLKQDRFIKIPPPNRGRQVPPEDFGFGRGIRPSELYDKLGNMVAGSGGVTPPEFAEYRKSPIRESFADFLARKRGGVTPEPVRGGETYKEFEGPDGSVLSVGVQDPLLELVKKRDPILPPEGITPRPPSIPPMTPPMTPRPMPMPMPRPMPMPMPMPEPVIPSMPMPQPIIPIEPQPMPMAGRQMNMMFDNMPPTMMRAGGGGISKAIVDLKNRLR